MYKSCRFLDYGIMGFYGANETTRVQPSEVLAPHKCCAICQVALALVAQDLLESEQTSHGSSVRKLSPFWRWLLPELPRHHALTSPEQHIPLACPWELKCSVSLARSQSLPLSCFWQHQTLRGNLAVIEFQKSGKYKHPKSHVYTNIYIYIFVTCLFVYHSDLDACSKPLEPQSA